MDTRDRFVRIAAAVVPTVAVLAASVALTPHASAAEGQRGQVTASSEAFGYRAASPDVGSFLDARITQSATGGYSIVVNPEDIDFAGSCAVTAASLLPVCEVSRSASIEATGNGGSDFIDLAAYPEPGEPAFTAPATIRTGGGNDRIVTSGIVARIKAGKGKDLISTEDTPVGDLPPVSTPGGDVKGGKGTDTVIYGSLAGVTIRVSLDDRANDGRPGEKDNIHSDVEDVVGPSTGFTAIGSARANVLTGGRSGSDHLVGRGGKDTLVGRGGDDRLDARDGRGGDVVSCGRGDDRVWLDRGDRMVDPQACERVTRSR